MTDFNAKRHCKDPGARTRLPLLPPAARSRRAHDLTRAAAEGRFALHRCGTCGEFSYPAPEACPVCLSAEIAVEDAADMGVLLSMTSIEAPADNYFRERAPWHVGLVKFDCGPIVLCHVGSACQADRPVRLHLKLDKAGQAVFFAAPWEGKPSLADDRQWQELTADPKGRRILITDGRNPVTLPLVDTLKRAGAANIYVGVSHAWKPFDAQAELENRDGVFLVSLDLASEASVSELARDYAAKTDILINTADHIRPGGILAAGQIGTVREALETMVLGAMRLAQGFAPAMISRGADYGSSAIAWANLLSIYAQANAPDMAGYAIAQAAARAFSHTLRAELSAGGVRVLNVSTGPTEGEWFQAFPQPKVRHKAIADAIVDGLKRGLEDVTVGDVAKYLASRLKDNPKAVERELAARRQGGAA